MPDPDEIRIQSYILAQLSLLPGVYARRQNTGGASTQGGRTVRFGTPGQADILAIVNGKYVEIEVKSVTGKQSPAQLAHAERVRAAGGIYILARCLEDALGPIRKLIAARATNE